MDASKVCIQAWKLLLEFLPDEEALLLSFASMSFHASHDFAISLVSKRGFHLAHVAAPLRTEALLAFAISQARGSQKHARRLWKSVPPPLKTRAMTEEMARWWPELIPSIVPEAWKTRAFARKVLGLRRTDEFAVDTLRFFPDLQDDKGIVLLAVSRNGNCIMSASEALKSDAEVALAALEGACFQVVLSYISSSLLRCGSFLKRAADVLGPKKAALSDFLTTDHLDLAVELVRASPRLAMSKFRQELRDNPRIWKTALALDAFSVAYAPWEQLSFLHALDLVTREPRAIFFLPSLWLSNKELVLAAVSGEGSVLGDYRLRAWANDKDVVLAAVKNNGLALEHASVRLKCSKVILKTAVSQTGLALAYAPRALRSWPELVQIAVRQNIHAIHFSRGPLDTEKLRPTSSIVF
jgi:hypothetical protein